MKDGRIKVLRFGVNLMYGFYSGDWLEKPSFNTVPEDIKKENL